MCLLLEDMLMEQVDTFKNATTVDKITFDSFEKNDSKRFPLVFKKEAKFINAMLDRPEFTDEQKAKFNTPDEVCSELLLPCDVYVYFEVRHCIYIFRFEFIPTFVIPVPLTCQQRHEWLRPAWKMHEVVMIFSADADGQHICWEFSVLR